MPLMMPTMTNFGDINNRDQGNRIFAHFGQGDDARNGDLFLMNKNVRSSNRRGHNRSLSHEQSRYRAFERNSEVNHSDIFDEHADLQARNAFGQLFKRNNHYWGRRGKRNSTNKNRRSGKCNPLNTAGLDE
ncbi:unnamed protein product, partial [Onchocerca ochengi]